MVTRNPGSPAYHHLLKRLQRAAHAVLAMRFGVALLGAAALMLGMSVFVVSAETIGYFAPSVKHFLIIAVVSIPLLLLSVAVMYLLLRRPGPVDAARLLEQTAPGLGNRLISAVQLGGQTEASLRGQSSELVNALVEQAADDIDSLRISSALPVRSLIGVYRTVAVLGIVFLLAIILIPGYAGGLLRLADAGRRYDRPGSTTIYTAPQQGRIIRGDDFTVSGYVAGKARDELRILYRWEHEERWQVRPVTVDDDGSFTALVEKPYEPFRYYLEAADAVTQARDVAVIERPAIESFTVSLTYPAYTGLGTVTRTDNDGTIRAITGTAVTIAAQATRPLAHMRLVMDGREYPCFVEGHTGTASFEIAESTDYYFALTDTLGISTMEPVVYRITALSDEYPRAVLLHPATDVVMPNSMELPVVYRVQDDFGMSAVELSYQLSHKAQARVQALPFDEGGSFTGEYRWDLSDMNLLPDDTVTFSVVAYDTDTVNGPKRGESEARMIRVPSVTDIYAETMESQQEGIDRLREVTDRAAEQQERLDEVNRTLKTGADLEWSDRQDVEQALEDMTQMQNDVQAVTEQLGEAAQRLSDEEVVAVETLAKMTEISALMEEIAEGDMKDALRQLTQAAVMQDPKAVKQLLDQYTATAEDIQKKLDRIIALLEQAKTLQQLEIATNLLEDMALRQAELAAEYERTPVDAHASREQGLASEMENIRETLEAAVDSVASQFGVATGDIEQALAETTVSSDMQQAADAMARNHEAEAGEQLDQANRGIADLLETMDTLGSRMEQANTEEIRRRLFTALNQMLALSDQQESLNGRIDTDDTDTLTRDQLALIEGLGRADASLDRVSELVSELAQVADQVNAATRMLMESSVAALSAGSRESGTQYATDSLKLLNRSIRFLASLMEQSSGSSSSQGMPGDLMQQLQQIASGQLDLQQQLSAGQMGQLAAEQQRLSEMLSQLAQRILEDSQLRGMLDRLAEEMDVTAERMRRDEPRELVERRQLDIYRRLLDARRSRREKNESEERTSWTARENISTGADRLAGDLGEHGAVLNARLREALEEDIDPAYKSLIRQYFESLLAQPEVSP